MDTPSIFWRPSSIRNVFVEPVTGRPTGCCWGAPRAAVRMIKRAGRTGRLRRSWAISLTPRFRQLLQLGWTHETARRAAHQCSHRGTGGIAGTGAAGALRRRLSEVARRDPHAGLCDRVDWSRRKRPWRRYGSCCVRPAPRKPTRCYSRQVSGRAGRARKAPRRSRSACGGQAWAQWRRRVSRGAEGLRSARFVKGAGDACPDGCGGKVYPQRDPGVLVRIKGQAPLAATVL